MTVTFQGGRLRPVPTKPRLWVSRHLTGWLPTAPPSADWMSDVIDWPMYGNDKCGDCFPPGTRIRMADGTTKPIEAVQTMDRVISAEGRERMVTATMVRHHDAGVVIPVLSGLGHLRCTPDHPFLTQRGYVAANQLQVGDMVASPAYAPLPCDEIACADHIIDNLQYRLNSTGFRAYGTRSASGRITPPPEKLSLSPEVGRLLGLFFAEGCTSQNTVRWTFGGHERETLVADVVRLVSSELKAVATPRQRGNGTIDVVLNGKQWRLLFESLCAKGAGGKRLHPDLWASPAPFREALLRGWLDGDGHHSASRSVGTTVSRDLAQDMFNTAQSLGLSVSIYGRQPPPVSLAYLNGPKTGMTFPRYRWDVSIRDWDGGRSKRGVGQLPNRRWRTKIAGKHIGVYDTEGEAIQAAVAARMGACGSGPYAVEIKEGVYWRSVREVLTEDYQGWVHNLSVEGDQSYVAEGVGVHNCTIATVGHAIQLASHYGQGKTVTISDQAVLDKYAALSGYNPVTGANDTGLVVQNVLNDWVKVGIDGHKALAFAQVDLANRREVLAAIAIFGWVYLGINFPDSAMDQFNAGKPWDVVRGATMEGGHAIPAGAYDTTHRSVVTWGRAQLMTPAFWAEFVEECWVVVTPEWLSAAGSTPTGLDLHGLGEDFASLTGRPNPFPDAKPAPVPETRASLWRRLFGCGGQK